MALTEEQGTALVRLARATIDGLVGGGGAPAVGRDGPPFLGELRGAFVTVKGLDGSLRGCIGFPYPVLALGEAVVEAAVGASTRDPRFPPMKPDELDGVLVEVSALTKPEQLSYRSPKELPSLVRIGVDGLIVSGSGQSGLLLPQVATEFGLSPQDFLSDACLKAGLMPDAWLTDAITVQRFQAEVFSEVSPRGLVARELD